MRKKIVRVQINFENLKIINVKRRNSQNTEIRQNRFCRFEKYRDFKMFTEHLKKHFLNVLWKMKTHELTQIAMTSSCYIINTDVNKTYAYWNLSVLNFNWFSNKEHNNIITKLRMEDAREVDINIKLYLANLYTRSGIIRTQRAIIDCYNWSWFIYWYNLGRT